jgi:Family of unknown function (DUF5317)
VLLLIAVLVAGVLIGLVLGGSLRRLGELSFRLWPLALIGLALQFVPAFGHGSAARAWGAGLLIASFTALTVFVVANIRVPGMALLAVGFVLNIVAIAVNGGMPVGDQALRVAYGSDYSSQLHELVVSGGAKHHLQGPSDTLVVLTDVIPVPSPVHLVISAGDALSFVGAAWVLAAATLGKASYSAEVEEQAK